MATNLPCHRVFLASPSGLEAERNLVRTAINEFNEEEAFGSNAAFIPFGYESSPGGFGRPQDEINQTLRQCDYAIVILADRWGSPPGGDNGYTSGTEEEYHEIVRAIEDPSLPMRDILVAFKSVPRPQMADPGKELAKVLQFRKHLEQEHALFYKTFDTEEELRRWVQQKLRRWARSDLGWGAAAALEDVPESDSIDESFSSPEELIKRASVLASKGAVTQAEVLFARAARNGGPEALLEFARFMRRRGRLEAAYQLDREYVEKTAPAGGTEDIIRRSGALANMGVVRRKQGRLRESRAHLIEAVEVGRTTGADGEPALAYALDNLALTALQQGDLATARRCFDEAHSIRSRGEDRVGVAQSLVNLARLDRVDGDSEAALARLTDAIEILREAGSNEPLLANALVGASEASFDLERPDASDLASEALALNERLANSDGISIASAVLARIALAAGSIDEAERHAQRTAEESASSANQEGLGVVTHLSGLIAQARGKTQTAIELLEEACTMFTSTGSTRRATAAQTDLEALREAPRRAST